MSSYQTEQELFWAGELFDTCPDVVLRPILGKFSVSTVLTGYCLQGVE